MTISFLTWILLLFTISCSYPQRKHFEREQNEIISSTSNYVFGSDVLNNWNGIIDNSFSSGKIFETNEQKMTKSEEGFNEETNYLHFKKYLNLLARYLKNKVFNKETNDRQGTKINVDLDNNIVNLEIGKGKKALHISQVVEETEMCADIPRPSLKSQQNNIKKTELNKGSRKRSVNYNLIKNIENLKNKTKKKNKTSKMDQIENISNKIIKTLLVVKNNLKDSDSQPSSNFEEYVVDSVPYIIVNGKKGFRNKKGNIKRNMDLDFNLRSTELPETKSSKFQNKLKFHQSKVELGRICNKCMKTTCRGKFTKVSDSKKTSMKFRNINPSKYLTTNIQASPIRKVKIKVDEIGNIHEEAIVFDNWTKPAIKKKKGEKMGKRRLNESNNNTNVFNVKNEKFGKNVDYCRCSPVGITQCPTTELTDTADKTCPYCHSLMSSTPLVESSSVLLKNSFPECQLTSFNSRPTCEDLKINTCGTCPTCKPCPTYPTCKAYSECRVTPTRKCHQPIEPKKLETESCLTVKSTVQPEDIYYYDGTNLEEKDENDDDNNNTEKDDVYENSFDDNQCEENTSKLNVDELPYTCEFCHKIKTTECRIKKTCKKSMKNQRDVFPLVRHKLMINAEGEQPHLVELKTPESQLDSITFNIEIKIPAEQIFKSDFPKIIETNNNKSIEAEMHRKVSGKGNLNEFIELEEAKVNAGSEIPNGHSLLISEPKVIWRNMINDKIMLDPFTDRYSKNNDKYLKLSKSESDEVNDDKTSRLPLCQLYM